MIEKNKISDEVLNDVAGGMILNSLDTPDYDPAFPWEVIDNNNGQILGKFATEGQAIEYAKRFGPDSYNTQKTDWGTVERLRKNPNTN